MKLSSGAQKRRTNQKYIMHRRQLLVIIIVIILGVGSALFYTNYTAFQVQKAAFEKANKELQLATKKNVELEEELKRLQDPEYAKQVATNKYALTNPEEGVYVFVLPNDPETTDE